MGTNTDERIDNELALLGSMYPGQFVFDERAQEIRYTSDAHAARLVVRISTSYPDAELPTILLATADRSDLRQSLHGYLVSECAVGEECIDRLILHFEELAEQSTASVTAGSPSEATPQAREPITVVIWLHHLLNTNKRKQAMSPPSIAVNGLTKPGYPGVLVYSGPADAVHEHVQDLRSLNWQAFQVRLEVGEAWQFTHGSGVVEVANMSEVVAEIGEDRKEAFMEAMKIK